MVKRLEDVWDEEYDSVLDEIADARKPKKRAGLASPPGEKGTAVASRDELHPPEAKLKRGAGEALVALSQAMSLGYATFRQARIDMEKDRLEYERKAKEKKDDGL